MKRLISFASFALLALRFTVALLAPVALLAQSQTHAAANSLSPIYRNVEGHGNGVDGAESYFTPAQPGFESRRAPASGLAFHAVVTNRWLPGLVPIFAVERAGGTELRRLPPRGQENISEPLFFGLPLENETPLIAGHWRCEATRADGSIAYPDFELATDGEKVSARFDQTTEYRYAFISGGTFLEGRLELHVDNVADKYLLTGALQGHELGGEWKHLQGDERGTWKASRGLPSFRPVAADRLVILYEYQRPAGKVRVYRTAGDHPGPAWPREGKPLCRVWKPGQVGK